MPARFGVSAALTTARICHGLTIAAFALLGFLMGLGLLYWLGVLVVAGLLVYRHSLRSPKYLYRLGASLFNVHGYNAGILFFFALGDRVSWPRSLSQLV